MSSEQERRFDQHREHFDQKRRRDAQKRQALWQFGKGDDDPPTPDDPRPTRMVSPVAYSVEDGKVFYETRVIPRRKLIGVA